MPTQPPAHPDVALSLALSVIASSTSPLLILDGDLNVVAASNSFCRAFEIDPQSVPGRSIFALGAGEWDRRRLRSLLLAIVEAGVSVEAYEMDLESDRQGTRRLIITAQRLDYADLDNTRILVAVSDITESRRAEKFKDDLLREKAVLIQEVQHRIANSLQIIASLIMQSARKLQSEEMRGHLHAAHDRVMSIAAVQQHLAASAEGSVILRSYLTQLCQSLAASMIGDHNQLSIEVDVDGSNVDGDASVSLGLIVTELVINALKHAFLDTRKGTITVSYSATGPSWSLSVKDNGVGMPTGSNVAPPGLGTSIIEALARQLEARITVADAGPGTEITLVHSHVEAGRGNVLRLNRAV